MSIVNEDRTLVKSTSCAHRSQTGDLISPEPAEEPFVFVTRKKNSRRQGPSVRAPAAHVPDAANSPQESNHTSNTTLPGWTTKKTPKIKKNSQRARMLGSRGINAEVRTIEWGLRMLEERVLMLKQSKFYEAFRVAPDQKTQVNAITDMVFYGIGSIENSRNSQFQLALGLCLKDILKTKQALESKTLLYMPHCPKGLYSMVIENNWSRAYLNDLIILGNRFTMYDERQLAKQAPYILPALSIARVLLLPNIKFEDNTVFNDLALHLFPPDKDIPEVDLTHREIDPELL
ncbi:hypothetical protein EDD11_006008 [Mortierella claussenii]|nr:hypothetical protein EDD11_006008 [Mortierella claussenii]